MRARWQDAGAQTVIDTSNVKVVMPGLADADTIGDLSQLCGQVAWGRDAAGWRGWHEVLTADMIRRLPAGFPLLIRGSQAPVIVSVAKGWKYPEYRKLRRRGQHVAAITSAAIPETLGPSELSGAVPRAQANGRPTWPDSPAVTGNGHVGDGTAWWAAQ
jgi:hypothetical protein